MSEALYQRKYDLLARQKEKSTLFHKHLTDTGYGLNEVSRKTCKNLEAAVAGSKRPGPIFYYHPPDESLKVVPELPKLQRQILTLQHELDQCEHEIAEFEKRTTVAPTSQAGVSSLSQWFALYGAPTKTGAPGFMTSFTTNSKVYGGTNRYPTFKTKSSVMKRGRLTK